MDNEGYVKSGNFPICSSGSSSTSTASSTSSSTTLSTSSTTASSACYSSVKDIPATCSPGAFTKDDYSGCRNLVCASSSGSAQVLACDKSGFFEMYLQSRSGTSQTICLGNTCMNPSVSGYAKSSGFPVCS